MRPATEIGGAGAALCRLLALQGIELGELRQGRRLVGRIGRQQLLDLGRAEPLRRQRKPEDLVVHVGGELHRHQLDDDGAVGRAPRLRPVPQQHELGGKPRLEPAEAAVR